MDVGIDLSPSNGTYSYHFRVGASSDVPMQTLKAIIDKEFSEGSDYEISAGMIKIFQSKAGKPAEEKKD